MGNFESILSEHRVRIENRITEYATDFELRMRTEYPTNSIEPDRAFIDMLQRGGKRLRGIVAAMSYRHHGGDDESVELDLALTVEMYHAYILMADDIQDRSSKRRGKPTAHELLRTHHEENELLRDSGHYGVSMAIDSFLTASHEASNLIISMNIADEARVALQRKINEIFISTAHGQTLDIYNEVARQVQVEDIDAVMKLKTAYYTFIGPLQYGAIAAGSDMEPALETVGLNAGYLFQVTDDILGVFGDDGATGKSNMDDIREGKQTVLVNHAMQHGSLEDAEYLFSRLGKDDLTQEEFLHCQTIVRSSGALKAAQELVEQYADKVFTGLSTMPESELLQFLSQLVNYLRVRDK